ncbi:hypothetical protein PRIPAC_81750 [Pristionchus pacificus]|uniref:Uncharacterized protein n=1 Tax=Pristionchus pacificus TaxID=54126 RepID=A0A2A6CP34_PRIPA|nr:hypothetical protein PRIPAC_81750 [Pristionchus pacificus]|eukprot:PDM79954.1 hypothetical protein PRIPAC_32533 [Pristionchus pacificus]
MTEKSTGQDVVVILILSMLVFASIFAAAIIIHITYELLSELTAPFTFIIVPASIIMTGLHWDKIVSFEVSIASYFIMHFHSFVQSTMILALTPTYRRFVLSKAQSILDAVNAGMNFVHSRVRTAPSTGNI